MGIGPSTKETTKHYFEDPLVNVFAEDPDIDFVGVIVVGTPQDNRMKHLVGQRVVHGCLGCSAMALLFLQTDGEIQMLILLIHWNNGDDGG